jgi:hypothetical protein
VSTRGSVSGRARAAARAATVGIVLAALVVSAGCGPRLPSDPPAIRGYVTSVSTAAGGSSNGAFAGTILVEGSKDAPGASLDKASLTVAGSVPVLLVRKDGTVEAASFADLRVGTKVEAWVDGPVRESYPVQADASCVAIVE